MYRHLESLYRKVSSNASDVENARSYLDTSSEAVIDHNCFLDNWPGVRDEGFVCLVIMDIKVSVCCAFKFDYEGILNSVLT